MELKKYEGNGIITNGGSIYELPARINYCTRYRSTDSEAIVYRFSTNPFIDEHVMDGLTLELYVPEDEDDFDKRIEIIEDAILEGQGDGYPICIIISGDEEWLMFGVEVDEEDEEYFDSGNYCLVIPE